jgi:DNA-binding beta-propeller fold protein YncE
LRTTVYQIKMFQPSRGAKMESIGIPNGGRRILGARAGVVACAVSASLLVFAVSARAATDLAQRPSPAGCITETGTSGACQDGRGLVGSASIAISPDGANAYVASAGWSSVATLSRNPIDGSLAPVDSPAGCFDDYLVAYTDCTLTSKLGGAYDIAISPDGKNVYVTAPADEAVRTFTRDTETGLLTPDGCVSQDGSEGCDAGRALGAATAVAISPDGKDVYVAGSGAEGGIAIFDRDTETGALEQKLGTAGCVNETGADGCTDNPLNEMLNLRDIELSPNGRSVYAVSRTRDAVTLYGRDTSTGVLTPAGCVNDTGTGGCADGKALIEAESVTVSPDETSVYVAGKRSDAIAIFDRNTVTGEIAQKPGAAGCVSNTGLSDQSQASTVGDCGNGLAMDGISSVAVLPDGSALYATADGSSGVDIFERHSDGTLTQRPGAEGCVTDTGFENVGLSWTAGYCADGLALLQANAVVASADSRFAYTAAKGGGVGIFDVIAPPVPPIPPVPVARPVSTAHRVSFTCRRAKAWSRGVRRGLRRRRRTVTWLARRARKDPHNKAKRHTLRRARLRVKAWEKRLRRANRRAHRACRKL